MLDDRFWRSLALAASDLNPAFMPRWIRRRVQAASPAIALQITDHVAELVKALQRLTETAQRVNEATAALCEEFKEIRRLHPDWFGPDGYLRSE